jgi:hypothetical protein
MSLFRLAAREIRSGKVFLIRGLFNAKEPLEELNGYVHERHIRSDRHG